LQQAAVRLDAEAALVADAQPLAPGSAPAGAVVAETEAAGPLAPAALLSAAGAVRQAVSKALVNLVAAAAQA
jgi:hypothetical protein